MDKRNVIAVGRMHPNDDYRICDQVWKQAEGCDWWRIEGASDGR